MASVQVRPPGAPAAREYVPTRAGAPRAEIDRRTRRGLLGWSPAVTAVHRLVDRLAPLDAPVLITGESGTGKEVVARAIHAESPRTRHPFVAVNCSALPEALLESELFGHRRSAFTGAAQDREGLFRAAGEGTLLLDEIGDLPLSMQPKILRAIEQREVRPVGASAPVPVHARILAATNRDLRSMVEEGTFRDDLWFRLNVLAVALPPLRERPGDVEILAPHLLRGICAGLGREVPALGPGVLAALARHRWPGNVRELSNVLERAVALGDGATIRVEDLPEGMRDDEGAPAPDDLRDARRRFERAHVLRVLAKWSGDRARAAAALGIDVSSLYRRLRGFGGAIG